MEVRSLDLNLCHPGVTVTSCLECEPRAFLKSQKKNLKIKRRTTESTAKAIFHIRLFKRTNYYLLYFTVIIFAVMSDVLLSFYSIVYLYKRRTGVINDCIFTMKNMVI